MGIKDNIKVVYGPLNKIDDICKVESELRIGQMHVTRELLNDPNHGLIIKDQLADKIFHFLYGEILDDLHELKNMVMYYSRPDTDVLRINFLFDQILKEIEDKR